jgi:hypothetical protein
VSWVFELILPSYARQLLENYQSVYSQLASQLRWLYFDDSFRLVTRVGYLDDGYIRLKLDGYWEFTGELLRELSWLYYSISEMGRNVDVLKNALASVGADKLRVSVVDALPLSPFNLAQVGGVALTGRDWSSDFAKLQNLDVTLTAQVALVRFGRGVSPVWVAGSEVTAPAAGTALVSRTVTSGKTGYVYGFLITAGEVNDFRLVWTSGGTARSLRIATASRGTVILVSPVPVNEGLPADGGTAVSVTNVNAGSSDVVYQVAILYAEV